MSRVWLITGASSGFGRRMTEAVLSKHEIVVAAVRSTKSLDDIAEKYAAADQLLVVKCDVTKRQDIESTFDSAYKTFGRVDVVFNNSGTGYMAEVETDEQEDEARAMFEVNFWGAGNVMREAIKSFRERNVKGAGGVLLNNSSVTGIVGAPSMGYYAASKHALEGLTETYSRELDPAWNIKITSIELSIFKTEAHMGKMQIFAPPSAYADPRLAAQRLRIAYTAENSPIPYGDPEKAVAKIYEVSKLESPPLRLPLGKASVAAIRGKWADFNREIDAYESWSEGLELKRCEAGL
ncbi:hypothetical protein ONZ45_g9381 [Pleurotus djamor]|nr:hypothetical protein ONZ45_g9381 [Pleurotus djamor]